MVTSKAAADWVDARARYVAAKALLKEADKSINEAEKELKAFVGQQAASEAQATNAVAEQENLVALTKKGYGRLLDSFGAVEVYEWWIKFPGGGGPAKGARAQVSRAGALTTYNTVDVQVKKKGGLGGAAVGGLLLGPVGAVAGYAVRRKTDIKTTNTPHTEDTREELVQISGKGFAYATSFAGWGTGTSLANAVNRRSSVTTTAKGELAGREAALARLIGAEAAGKRAGKSALGKANREIEEAWEYRSETYSSALSRWKKYAAVRPSLLIHAAATIVPGIESRSFNVFAPVLLAASLATGLYSALGAVPSPNPADFVAVAALVGFGWVLLDARQLEPAARARK